MISNRKETLFLLLGDIGILYGSLWIALTIRNFEMPSQYLWNLHITPFSILIGFWVLSFFIAGLYDRHTLIFRRRLPIALFQTQLVNIAIGVLYFYLIPQQVITPRGTLIFYIFVSFVFILAWRFYGLNLLSSRKRYKALLIGSGGEMEELLFEINNNPRYPLMFVASVDVSKADGETVAREVTRFISRRKVSVVIMDQHDKRIEEALPSLYNLLLARVQFLDIHKTYEQVFNRIPLSLVDYGWFLRNVPTSSRYLYGFARRILDTLLALFMGIVSLLLYPLVYCAIKLDDGGPVFFRQERVGQYNKKIFILKFRTMEAESEEGRAPKVTRAGKLLRMTRIDEIPQLWNIVRGDLALIGPRPEIPHLVEEYEAAIPYYSVRHLVKPGLSGWGQIHDHNVPRVYADVEKTKTKLSYDLYYIKNQSFLLDLEIILKTVKTLLSRSGV